MVLSLVQTLGLTGARGDSTWLLNVFERGGKGTCNYGSLPPEGAFVLLTLVGRLHKAVLHFWSCNGSFYR